MNRILIVGAGLSGAVIARELAEAGFRVHVIESRKYVAGNCHTSADPETGIMVHTHGPHIFHTDNEEVWTYVNQHAEMMPYICRVKATTRGSVYSLPINLHTINQFFGKTLNPSEAQTFISQLGEGGGDPVSFEQQALHFLGRDLYEAFFMGYPLKQWGIHPSELPASILKRLPIRFNYDDNYFNHRYQGIPRHGYTNLISSILKHVNIEISLDRPYITPDRERYAHIFFSGTLDSWFDYRYGNLGYRTLRFERSKHEGDFQGCAVMSYPEQSFPYTRITEHKHFTPWATYQDTVVFHEYSSLATVKDIPYYPIRLVKEKAMLQDYMELAKQESGVTFVGRLGTYRYLDMDVTIAEALYTAKKFLEAKAEKIPVQPFYVG